MTTTKYKVHVAGCGENTWSTNGLVFDTTDAALVYAKDLLGRWKGADMARVVPEHTPIGEPIDMADPSIVLNYRGKDPSRGPITIGYL